MKKKHLIAQFRKLNHMTQQDLADKVDVTRNYIALIESGKRSPTLKTLEKIAKAFDTKLEWTFKL